MSTPKGYSSQEKEDRLSAQFSTVEPIKQSQFGLSVASYATAQEWALGTVDAGSTASVLVITDCAPAKGDIIYFQGGVLYGTEVRVWDVNGTSFELAETLPSAPSAGDAIQVLRYKSPLVDGDGKLVVSLSELAIETIGSPLADDKVKMAGGLDSGGIARAIQVDTDGQLQVDVLSSALPAGAATETTLSALNGKVTACDTSSVTVVSSALPTGAATETTLSSLDGKVTACDTGSVTVVSSALPTGAATEATLGDIKTSVQLIDDVVTADGVAAPAKALLVAGMTSTGTAQFFETNASGHLNVADGGGSLTVDATSWPLPTDAATETTLSTLNGKVTACNTGAVTISSSALPTGAATESTLSTLNGKVTACNTGAVTISTALPSGTNTIGKVDVNCLSVIDLLDANILDTSSVNIPGSSSSPVQVVASTAAATKKLQLLDTTGAFIGVYTGAAASEVLQFVMGPGSDQTIEHAIPASTRISLKRLDSTTAVSSGIVAINFIG